MALYVCKVGTPDGRVIMRYCNARNRFELRESLEEEGYCVFRIRRAFFSFSFFTGFRKKGWSLKRFLLFNQEMLVLLRAGMPILDILESLVQEKDPPPIKEALTNIAEAVKGGSSLSGAFSSFPAFFPPLYVATVASGEKTGDLVQNLSRYLTYQKRMAHLRDRLKSAALYPAVLVVATLAVLLFMVFFVVPSFVEIFADAQVPLPWLTRMVLRSSALAVKGWPLVLLAGVAGGCFLRRLFHKPHGKKFLDKVILKMPLVGDFFRLSGLVNFCRTTGTILGSGLPLIEAMELGRGVLNNAVLQAGIGNVIASVNEGETLGGALSRQMIFPPVALRMISTGEKSGTLDQMFDEVAEYYESELDNRLERLASLAEPIILVFVGLIIGGIVVAIYLPVFQLAGTVG